MEYQGTARRKKLVFKSAIKQHDDGKDKPAEMKKAKPRSNRKRHTASNEESKDWIPIQAKSDLEGPLTIYFQNKQLYMLSLSSKEEMQVVADMNVLPPKLYMLEGMSLANAKPSMVEQVFVGRRSVPVTASSDEQSNLYSFRSCRGTYLSSTKQGGISCISVAIGPLEMWMPVLLPEKGEGAVALGIRQPANPEKTCYLSANMLLTGHDSLVLSASEQIQQIDTNTLATSIGPDEVFTIKCQAAIQKKRRKRINTAKSSM